MRMPLCGIIGGRACLEGRRGGPGSRVRLIPRDVKTPKALPSKLSTPKLNNRISSTHIKPSLPPTHTRTHAHAHALTFKRNRTLSPTSWRPSWSRPAACASATGPSAARRWRRRRRTRPSGPPRRSGSWCGRWGGWGTGWGRGRGRSWTASPRPSRRGCAT